jgi:hypothetical protein
LDCSKSQEEYAERQFQEIESRKKNDTEAIKRKSQVKKCLELLRGLTTENQERTTADLSEYPIEVVEEAGCIVQLEKKREIQEEEKEARARREEMRLKPRKEENALRN